jgi:hypothetical protein
MHVPVTPLALLLCAGAIGCGNSETADRETRSDSSSERTEAQQNAYEAGRDVCAHAGHATTAKELGLPPTAAPYEIAEAYGREMSTPSFRVASSAGCMDGLKSGRR